MTVSAWIESLGRFDKGLDVLVRVGSNEHDLMLAAMKPSFDVDAGCTEEEMLVIDLMDGDEGVDLIDEVLATGPPDLSDIELLRAHRDEARAILRQVEDVLANNYILVDDGDWKGALHRLIAWNIQVANDPAVSQDAADRASVLAELRADRDRLDRLADQYGSDLATAELKLADLRAIVVGLEAQKAGAVVALTKIKADSGSSLDLTTCLKRPWDHDVHCESHRALAALSADPLKVGK